MIISLRIKNFYSLREYAVLDFTSDSSKRQSRENMPENLIEFAGDRFINIIGLFGSNAAGKSNIIKAIEYCRNLVLTSHLNNEGDELDYKPFKFGDDRPSEFYINFVTNGTEYEYSFSLFDGKVLTEELHYYPHKRKSKIFSRTDTNVYSFKKGVIFRPAEVESSTGPKTLFLSMASARNREAAQIVYRFFLNQMVIGIDSANLVNLSAEDFKRNKEILLKGLEISDSDITDIKINDHSTGLPYIQSFHRENPAIPFDFLNEESEGTKRLMSILILLLKKREEGTTFFFDEFDLKLHLRLAELVLDLIRLSGKDQIVFTSHNPWLIDKNALRSEQIVFVNKNADGNSEFTALYDYQHIGKNTDLRLAYLQGRFDAVPYVGNVRDILDNLINNK